jgi:hypothetical protein
MEYCNEDFTILSLIPIEIMNNKMMIKLIKIALNYYNYKNLDYDISYKISNKSLKDQLYKLYSIQTVDNNSYIINFYS